MIAKTPELALTDDEAKLYAQAVSDVQKHYPLPVLDPGYVAIGALCSTAFVIYRGKFQQITERKEREAKIARGDNAMPIAGQSNNIGPAEPAPWFTIAPTVN